VPKVLSNPKLSFLILILLKYIMRKTKKPILIKPKRLAHLTRSKSKDKIIRTVIRESVSITLTNLEVNNKQRRAEIQRLCQYYVNANFLGNKTNQTKAIQSINAVLFEQFNNSTKSRNATLKIIDDFQKNLLTTRQIL
jgi:hypothetical protein